MLFNEYKKNIFIGLAIILISYFVFSRFHKSGHGPDMAGGAAPVSVSVVIERKVQQWNEFSGRLVAVDTVEIRPRVSGVIESVNFKNGAYVNKNDLLFTIDSRIYAADVARAEGVLASAQAQALLARSEQARSKRLFKEKAIPQREFDERNNAANVAEANLKSALASYESAKLNLEYTQVKSPITGKVSRAEITVGNLVEAGSNAPVLTSVVSSDPIYMDFEVDEDTFLQYANARLITDNKDNKIPVIMTLGGSSDIPHKGFVESFDNRLNTASGTIRARAVFSNADGMLLPGLFARIKLGNETEAPAILITDRAIGTDQNKKFVFVVENDNKISYREIKLGPVVDGLRVVREGLKPGEKIVVNGLQRTRPGMVVTPEVVAMDSK